MFACFVCVSAVSLTELIEQGIWSVWDGLCVIGPMLAWPCLQSADKGT